MIKLGILSRPTYLGGRTCSTTVQTSETRIEEEDEKSQGRTYEETTVDKDHYKFTRSVNTRIRCFTRLGEISAVNRRKK